MKHQTWSGCGVRFESRHLINWGVAMWLSLSGLAAARQEAANPTATPTLPNVASTPADPARASKPKTDPEADLPSYSEVRVSEFMTVDLIVQNDDIRNVLQKLAVQTRRNIVPSSNVTRRVTCTVYGAPFYDALDALLNANGLGYIERGEFIYVFTAQELSLVKTDVEKRLTRTIHLNYLRPDDAQRFARGLLSKDGWIEATQDRTTDDASKSGGSGSGGSGAASPTSKLSNSSSSVQSADGSIYSPDKDEYSLISAIVLHDYAENIAEIEELLKSLDLKPSQVLIEATIVQTSLSEQNAFGVDFALLSEVQFTEFFGFPSNFEPLDFFRKDRTPLEVSDGPSTTRENKNFVASTPGNTGLGPATVRGAIIAGDAAVFIRALDQVTDVTLLSNPKVLALNRQRARVLVGTRVGYLETTTVENQVMQSIKYLDTGIELDMRPFILDDRTVRLELAPKVSAATFRTVAAPGVGSQQIPDEQLQTVNTNVQIPEGYTAVLGGLFREDTSRSRSQVPLLGDIPVVGAAFQGRDDKTDRVEIMFLIKPTVMQDKIIVEHGRNAEAWKEAVRVGSREGLLPWSRDRQSARLNLDAERRRNEGDLDGALWSVRRSLELHPMQPDAVRLRDSLVNSPEAWPERSLLERIINAEASSSNESTQAEPEFAPPDAPPPPEHVEPEMEPPQ
ncbi:MAG: type II secretion system protein GspD [Phycisphaerae bacterium]|nr:type II secretion system protein GspD [Phycisphaerae bacterium]